MKNIHSKISPTLALLVTSYLLLVFSYSFFVTPALAASTVTDTINVYLTVNTCNLNGKCDLSIGENANNCAPDCTSTPPPGETLLIYNVATTPTLSLADLKWQTNLSAISTIVWGKTLSYEIGVIKESVSNLAHASLFPDLKSNTKYYFKIDAVDPQTLETATYSGFFQTLPINPSVGPPPNVLDFIAVYNLASKGVDLTWTNPTDPNFDSVKIMRSTIFFPIDPDEGDLIYEGKGEYAFDPNVVANVTYYYTLFTRNSVGEYSSGSIAWVLFDDEEIIDSCDDEICVIPPEPPPPPPVFDFETIPPSEIITPPEVIALSFLVDQEGQLSPYIFNDGSVLILERDKKIRVSAFYDNLPEVLKTIVVTLQHPKDKSKVFSFILRVDKSKKIYSATIGQLIDPGEYITNIYMLDYKFASLRKISGKLIIPGPAFMPLVIRRIPTPMLTIGQAVGIVSGLVQIIIMTTQARTVYEIYLAILRALGALFGFLGFRRRHRPWGTVYDSVTKRPLDPAFVVARQNGYHVTDAITDLDGRYGFFLPGGRYALQVNKTHYRFPSSILADKNSDELYNNLYFGEELLVPEGEVITRNIPLDPIGFDWNEFAKNKMSLMRLSSRREKIKLLILDSLYIIGFILAILALLITPSGWNFSVVSLYITIFAIQTFWRVRQHPITIKDATSGEPYSYAVVRIFLDGLNQEIKRIIADEFGRFFALVSPGKYYITIDAKGLDGSYTRVYRSAVMNLNKGLLRNDILIGEQMPIDFSILNFQSSPNE